MDVAVIEEAFPQIRSEGYQITSDETPDYNCFAWVMGITSQWWSPVNNKGYYWLDGIPKTLAVKNFVELFRQAGNYLPCEHEHAEAGFEKIALFADANGNVTHVAKQIESGKWQSKLGDWEDIEHNTLAALEGKFYGKAVQFLKRAVT